MSQRLDWPWKYLWIEILYDVGQDQRSTSFVENRDLAEEGSAHQNGCKVLRPFSRSSVIELAIDPDARRSNLASTCKTGRTERQCIGYRALPVLQEHPMHWARADT
jgi:hypothetical protein